MENIQEEINLNEKPSLSHDIEMSFMMNNPRLGKYRISIGNQLVTPLRSELYNDLRLQLIVHILRNDKHINQ